MSQPDRLQLDLDVCRYLPRPLFFACDSQDHRQHGAWRLIDGQRPIPAGCELQGHLYDRDQRKIAAGIRGKPGCWWYGRFMPSLSLDEALESVSCSPIIASVGQIAMEWNRDAGWSVRLGHVQQSHAEAQVALCRAMLEQCQNMPPTQNPPDSMPRITFLVGGNKISEDRP